MNNQLQIFNNQQFGQVRTLLINNEPHFVGKDVAVALGYSNTSDALKVHVYEEDRKQIAFHDLQKSGLNDFGTKGGVLINESGLYSLIFGSKLEKAKEFKRWVTSEVLPSIRKTGSYRVNDAKAREDKIYEELMQLPNDDLKNFTVNRMLDLLGISNKSIKQKVEMSENAFRDLVVEFMNENDVVMKRHKQGLIIDKDALYKYFDQYGWTEHDILETLDKYKMIYHKGEDRTYQITIGGKLVRTLIIQ